MENQNFEIQKKCLNFKNYLSGRFFLFFFSKTITFSKLTPTKDQTTRIMKTLIKLSFTVFLMIGLLSCNKEEDPMSIGTGDVKVGIGVKINSASNPGARTQNTGLEINSGFLQVKKIELETQGVDENGRFERELEFKFPEILKIDFNEFDQEVDFFINIPAGNYEEIEFEIDLIDNRNLPSIQLDGTFGYQNGNDVPFRLEVFGDDDDDLDFEVELEAKEDDGLFFLDGINNPLALLDINAKGWFSVISNAELEKAELTDGVLLISRSQNKGIYDRVLEKIENSSEIELEIK
jgi:hypothetical protein